MKTYFSVCETCQFVPRGRFKLNFNSHLQNQLYLKHMQPLDKQHLKKKPHKTKPAVQSCQLTWQHLIIRPIDSINPMFSLYFLERMLGAGFCFKTRSCQFCFEEHTFIC